MAWPGARQVKRDSSNGLTRFLLIPHETFCLTQAPLTKVSDSGADVIAPRNRERPLSLGLLLADLLIAINTFSSSSLF